MINKQGGLKPERIIWIFFGIIFLSALTLGDVIDELEKVDTAAPNNSILIYDNSTGGFTLYEHLLTRLGDVTDSGKLDTYVLGYNATTSTWHPMPPVNGTVNITATNCSVDNSCPNITYDTELNYYTDADIDGTEAAFTGWDKDASNDFSGSWNDLTNIPAGFADNIDNNSGGNDTRSEGTIYLYNDSTYMYLNETRLNNTISVLDTDTDTDTHVEGTGYLYNDSTLMYLNETQLNATIDELDDIGTGYPGDEVYLYNDTAMHLNETVLNTTIRHLTGWESTPTTTYTNQSLYLYTANNPAITWDLTRIPQVSGDEILYRYMGNTSYDQAIIYDLKSTWSIALSDYYMVQKITRPDTGMSIEFECGYYRGAASCGWAETSNAPIYFFYEGDNTTLGDLINDSNALNTLPEGSDCAGIPTFGETVNEVLSWNSTEWASECMTTPLSTFNADASSQTLAYLGTFYNDTAGDLWANYAGLWQNVPLQTVMDTYYTEPEEPQINTSGLSKGNINMMSNNMTYNNSEMCFIIDYAGNDVMTTYGLSRQYANFFGIEAYNSTDTSDYNNYLGGMYTPITSTDKFYYGYDALGLQSFCEPSGSRDTSGCKLEIYGYGGGTGKQWCMYGGTAVGDKKSFYIGYCGTGPGQGGDITITPSTTAKKLDIKGELTFTGTNSDGTGKALCVKSDGNIGTCTSTINSTGYCTCG